MPQIYTVAQYKRMQSGAKGSDREHNLQAACVRWFRVQYPNLRDLLISVPNGAALLNGAKGWRRLEAEGALKGASDLILLVGSGDYSYLCIEMKTPKGKQSASQKQFEAAVVGRGGGGYAVPRSLDEFIRVVRSYLATGAY